MPSPPLSLLQGTLDLIVLRAVASGPMHGYGLAALVRDKTGGDLAVEDAALYQALHRLERQGCIDAEWAPSDNNRRARYYSITRVGRKRLTEQAANWRRYAKALEALLRGI